MADVRNDGEKPRVLVIGAGEAMTERCIDSFT